MIDSREIQFMPTKKKPTPKTAGAGRKAPAKAKKSTAKT
jgi:hypothetical protein